MEGNSGVRGPTGALCSGICSRAWSVRTAVRARQLTTMKVLYPASHNIPQLNESALALKIARHSHCSTCSSCSGLRPPPGVAVTLDEEDINKSLGALAGYDSDDSDSSAHGYLQSCTCGHEVLHHGADKAAIGADEFARRARVSVRLDEFLQVSSSEEVVIFR